MLAVTIDCGYSMLALLDRILYEFRIFGICTGVRAKKQYSSNVKKWNINSFDSLIFTSIPACSCFYIARHSL